MKRITKVLLTVILLVSTFSYALIHNCEHVHAINAGDMIRLECPNCHHVTYCMATSDCFPDCTNSATCVVACQECGLDFIATIPALGHDFSIVVSNTKATCTKDGFQMLECSRCGTTQGVPIPALGHKYKSKVTKEATCTVDGEKTYTCSRCGNSYTKAIPALGHDIDLEEKEATCTEDGYKKGTCKRCGEVINEIYPDLGHDIEEYTVIEEPTCTEDGLKEGVCNRCNETVQESIEKLGHVFPEEWTIDKDPGFFHEGLKSKTCDVCGEKISEAIPKKSILPLVIGGLGGLSILGMILYLLRKTGRLGRKLAEKIGKEAIKPSFETKTILASTKDEKLVELLKKQSYLKIVNGEYADIAKDFEENGADLVICDVLSEERLDEIVKMKKDEKLQDGSFGLVVSQEILGTKKKKLDKLAKDKQIISYVPFGKADYSALVKLILPVLKPDIKSDESLDNLGKIADAMGIPFISTLVNVYTSGKDIKETLEEGELGVSETAAIIGDIASILGLDKLADV
ncbi:MAG: hypothetical protein IKE38_00055, partial [Erysipelotrichaceae bacterium]|nr:hypothetical protein [Erysipelotrichaceae bacterium]